MGLRNHVATNASCYSHPLLQSMDGKVRLIFSFLCQNLDFSDFLQFWPLYVLVLLLPTLLSNVFPGKCNYRRS